MERVGLVSQVTEQLERMISLGNLPKDRGLPSEQKLAKSYGVSRATVREALLRLAAKGLVVQHPGRQSRAVALDEALTLENLGVALHTDGRVRPMRRRLLEGYFTLKRDMAIELLVACCEHASPEELDPLEAACFALREEARWQEDSGRWVKQEFELLRLAAGVASRPGHYLLIQSLERAFWGMADKVLPHQDSESTQQWALCALHALAERNPQTLRRELLALLQASDERLLDRLAPACEAEDSPKAPHTDAEPIDAEPIDAEPIPVGDAEPEPAEGQVSGAVSSTLSDNQTVDIPEWGRGGGVARVSPAEGCIGTVRLEEAESEQVEGEQLGFHDLGAPGVALSGGRLLKHLRHGFLPLPVTAIPSGFRVSRSGGQSTSRPRSTAHRSTWIWK